MTEAEWLTGADPTRMLKFVRGQVSNRKLRLFAVACCRAVWRLLSQPDSRLAVEVSEKYADGNATWEELSRAEWLSEASFFRLDRQREAQRLEDRLIALGAVSADEASDLSASVLSLRVDAAHAANLAAGDVDSFLKNCPPDLFAAPFLFCICGNHFHSGTLDPSWQTSTAVALAQGIYDDRAFDRLPILADALQDAGCENADILTHCRGDGPHVRGCWVVDLVLGKS